MIQRILHKAPEEVTGVQTIQGQLSSLCVPFSEGGTWGNGSDQNSHLLRLQNTSIILSHTIFIRTIWAQHHSVREQTGVDMVTDVLLTWPSAPSESFSRWIPASFVPL